VVDDGGSTDGDVRWLIVSLLLSVVLTVVLNTALRIFPDLGRRVARGLADLTSPGDDDPDRAPRQVRVVVPWKAMVVVSVILTFALNVLLWIV
jgi:hypothetical protein